MTASEMKAIQRARQKSTPHVKQAHEMSKPELMWVVGGHTDSGMLHYPALNEYETDMLSRRGMYFGGVVLCSQAMDEMDLPGPKTSRIGARCSRCCKLLGYPQGVGSPIHDAQIRVMIGLDRPPVPVEWQHVDQRVQMIRNLCLEWKVRARDLNADDYEVGRADMAGAVLQILDEEPVGQEDELAS